MDCENERILSGFFRDQKIRAKPLPREFCLVCSVLLLGYRVTTLAVLFHVGDLPTPPFCRGCKGDRILLQPPIQQKRAESPMHVEIGYFQHRSHRLALLCKVLDAFTLRKQKIKGKNKNIDSYMW